MVTGAYRLPTFVLAESFLATVYALRVFPVAPFDRFDWLEWSENIVLRSF